MGTRFVTFILLASILTTAVYSSSMIFVYGAGKATVSGGGSSTVCSFSNNGNVASCSTPRLNLFCTYDTAAQKWSCHRERTGSATPNQMPSSETLNKMTDSQIPLGLKSAIDASEMIINNSPNPPECPKTGPIPPDCTMKPPLK